MCESHIHSPWRLYLSGTVAMAENRSTMLCWRRFFPLPSPFIATLAPSLATLSCSHTRSRQSHELTMVHLACQRLDSVLKFFCNSLTFQCWERTELSELSIIKWPTIQMLNVVGTLQQRCGSILTMSDSNVVTTLESDVATTLIFDLVTKLWQRQPRRFHNFAVPAGKRFNV